MDFRIKTRPFTTCVSAVVVLTALVLTLQSCSEPADERAFEIGIARVDITPDHPVRMYGYSARQTESEGVEQRLWAKALALGSDEQGVSLLITADIGAVWSHLTEEVFVRLREATGIGRENFVILSSHTHTGPILSLPPTLFPQNFPEDHQARVDQYTRQLVDRLEQVALAALQDRQPRLLAWSQGEVTFAANRRVLEDGSWTGFGVNPDGPVDHDMPMLRVTSPEGELQAVLVNYASHNTTFDQRFMRMHGDWAGSAQAFIEETYPGVTAMIAIGCGADANPLPRIGDDFGLSYANQHGRAVAAEVSRLLEGNLVPLSAIPTARMKTVELPFETLPTRAQWEERAEQGGATGRQARLNLERLDRGEELPASFPYLVQTWTFGDDLAMVFLVGEVVVDYSLRLKKELDRNRLWVNAYANDVPGYIPSKRILQEGGYEAERGTGRGNRPVRFAPETEDLIIKTVHDLLPGTFSMIDR